MPNPDDDAAVGGPEPTDPAPASNSERISLTVPDPEPTEDRELTLDELIAEARLPEDYAQICLRADLEAELTKIDAELGTLVDAQGNVFVDDDEDLSVGDANHPVARARQLAERRRTVHAEMAKSVRFVRFRGLSSTAAAAFDAQHALKKGDANPAKVQHHEDLLIAATAVAPEITLEQMAQYRDHLGPRSIARMVRISRKVCAEGGVDVPKPPVSSVNLARD